MKYIVRNMTRRPVSILCNSGRSYHLPPKYAHEIADIEIANNTYVKKLTDRRVLQVSAPEKKSVATKKSATTKQTRGQKKEAAPENDAGKRSAARPAK